MALSTKGVIPGQHFKHDQYSHADTYFPSVPINIAAFEVYYLIYQRPAPACLVQQSKTKNSPEQ